MAEESTVDSNQADNEPSVRQITANGLTIEIATVETKLDGGDVEDAETFVRDGLSLNSEESRALLGRLECQRGKYEAALRVLNGIDLYAAIDRIQPSVGEKQPARKGRSRTESMQALPHNSANLLLEGIYAKAKSLQKLGKLADATQECKTMLDAVEKMFNNGVADNYLDNKLVDTVGRVVELHPKLLKQGGSYTETMSAYRRALLSQWNLDNDCCARIQKGFAVFLLYSGIEVSPPSLAYQIDGSYVPRNNLEEAILLLMILMRKFYLGKTEWDPLVIEHLTFALSLCSQTSVLAKQLEEVMPGVMHRVERWKKLALCYCGAGQNKTALDILRKILHIHEKPDELMSLLVAAKICSEDTDLSDEGARYAERAVTNSEGLNKHLKGVALRMLGLCLGQQAKVSSSDFERARLQSEALKALDGAITLENGNSDLIFELGVQYAEQHNLNAALRYAKQYIDATGGSVLKGWRLLALVLSAQQRYLEAQVVTDAALDETSRVSSSTEKILWPSPQCSSGLISNSDTPLQNSGINCSRKQKPMILNCNSLKMTK